MHNDSDVTTWAGRSETLRDVATPTAAANLAAILDRTPEPPATVGAPLFPVGHWLHFTPTARMSDLGTDGHPHGGGLIPDLGLPRRMWAGSSVTYHAPIALGDTIERTSTIESVTPKNGSTGKLCFVSVRHDIRSAGTLARVEKQTLVYREAAAVTESAGRPPREDGATPSGWDWTRALRPDEATLFRYSAVTFNAHRIHYDLPYATSVEGYPGLVVHGPLLATYIVDTFLAEHPDADITAFEFSARAPLFANELFHVCGRRGEPGADGTQTTDLQVIGPDGKPCTTARIEYR